MKLVKVVFGSATQGLWLKDRKVESQVIGKQSRLPKRGTVRGVRRSQLQNSREKSKSSAMIDRGVGVSLTIIITFVSCSKSLMSH